MRYLDNKMKAHLFFFILGFMISCKSSGIDPTIAIPDATSILNITIDPKDAILNKETSEILDSILYLPLETTAESMFADITQMEITPQHYIIWDETSNAIFFFSKEGSFSGKITNEDKSLDIPFKKIGNFALNREKKQLLLSDRHSSNLYIYSLEGKFIKRVRKPDLMSSQFWSFKDYDLYFHGYLYLNRELSIPPVSLILTKRGKKDKIFFPFDTTAVDYKDVYALPKVFFDNQHNLTYFSKPFDYTVYAIDSLAILTEKFRFNLPGLRTVPDDFLSNEKYNHKRITYVQKNLNLIYALTDFYINHNTLVFRLTGHWYNELFIYSLLSKKLISLSEYISDDMPYMLPIHSTRIHGINQNGDFISSIDAVTMFANKLTLGKNSHWETSLPEKLKQFYRGNNLQNPMLTILSIKNNL